MTSPVVTIRDVASEAGVAVSTVSRVLNESGYASAEVRGRVLAAAEQLGFRPSLAARGLRRSRTMTLGVLVTDLANPVFLHHVRGAESVAQRHGYALLIGDGQASAEVQAAQLDRLYQNRVDGVLLAGPVLAREALRPFLDAGIPVAPRAHAGRDGIAAGRMRSEDAAGLAAYRYLLGLGHRRFATFQRMGDGGHPAEPSSTRLTHLRSALADCEETLDPDCVFKPETLDEVRAAVRVLLRRPDPPTAYIALNHVVTPLLLIALAETGLRLPEDLSLLTYGDSVWAQAHQPPIATVRSDYVAEAALYTESLIARVERWEDQPEEREFEAEFVPRGSCGPAPA